MVKRPSRHEETTAAIERFPSPVLADPQAVTREEYADRLRKFGLEEHEVEMVLDRFWDGLGWDEMVEKRGWAASDTASYVMRKLLRKLRKRGFNFK